MGRLDVSRILQDPLQSARPSRKERRENRDVALHHEYRKPPGSVQVGHVILRWRASAVKGNWTAALPGGWCRVQKVAGLWISTPDGPREVVRYQAQISIPAAGWDLFDLGVSPQVQNDPRRSTAIFSGPRKAQDACQFRLEKQLRLYPSWAPWLVWTK